MTQNRKTWLKKQRNCYKVITVNLSLDTCIPTMLLKILAKVFICFNVICFSTGQLIERRMRVLEKITNMTEEYSVDVIREADTDEVMDLLRRTFYLDEPLNKAVNLCTPNTDCPEVEEYCRKDLLSGLSTKAVDRNGKIIGVCISGVYPLVEENGNDLLSQALRCKNLKFQKILYILARRESGAKLWDKFPEDDSLAEITVAATDPSWRRKGIMNSLVKETERLARKSKIRLLRLDTSSYYSAKSAERQNFTCVYRALYTDIKLDGQPIIVPEAPHVDDRVYIKTL